MSATGLVVEGVTKDYPGAGGPLPVLAGVSLALEPGDAVAITGPSGSGKSTLLHVLGALDAPTRGTVTLAGVNPYALGERGMAGFRSRSVGFVFQDHHLLPQCSALENVLIPTLILKGADRAKLEAHARRLLDVVGLGSRTGHRPAELSGGERQRVAVARALVNSPALVLADEPTGNLDQLSAAAVADLLLGVRELRPTILIAVTHSAELAARFPRTLSMRAGKLEPAAV